MQDNNYCTPVLLYAILAVAASYSHEPDSSDIYDPSTASIGFALKTKQLIFEEIKAPRLSTMVATALISVTELSLDIEPARWMYISRPPSLKIDFPSANEIEELL